MRKSMFEVLNSGGPEEEEVTEEEQAEEAPSAGPSIPPPSAPGPGLSKSAKKRQAKLAKASTSNATEEHSASEVTTIHEASVAKPSEVTATITDIDEATAKPAGLINGHSNGDIETPVVRPDEDVSKEGPSLEALAAKPAIATSPAASPAVKTSPPTKTLKSSFDPELPSSLPTPSSSALPENRKRKAPQDFTPAGHSSPKSLASPNKLGVKFEDGVTAGQGVEGEKTIPASKVPAKHQNAVERTIWTFIMIGGFITLLCLGHPYMILLVLLCQTLVYKEVTALFELRDYGSAKSSDNPDDRDKWSKTLNWYFFVVTNYFLYGESIIYYFKHIVFVDRHFIPFARNHRFISFMMYVVGFMGFVANLQRQYLRQQFALFCWVHISLLLIVVSSHFIVNNILEGHIWFFVPASLVICNDVMAYVCGKMFGRTPLIKLSPKKTVEGFVGAFICTLIFGLAWGTFFMRFPYMTCPASDLGTNVFSHVSCKPNPVFVWRDFVFTGPARSILQTILGRTPPSIPYAPFQIHVLVMATFASLVAPFGGFFASGFKRAFNIKDFGHSIPGHGGMTDRMDCQFMMGLFSYVYYSSLIRIQNVTVGSIMQAVATSLTTAEQLELFADLKRYLDGQGIRVK